MNRFIVSRSIAFGAALAIAGPLSWTDAEGAGARAGQARSVTRTSVNNVSRTNVNVSRNVNIDVDNHRDYHPVARTAVAVAVVGAVVHTLPPACSAVVVNGITYQNCSGTWYQPQFAGTQVTYVVVNAPQ